MSTLLVDNCYLLFIMVLETKEKPMTHPTEATMKNHLNTKDYALVGLFVSLMAICAWITIPSAVPFTMQTFGVFLACALLGGKRGTLTVVIYILLGAIGLPVFSGFTGGFGHIVGPTGGYILGFVGSALVMWLFEKLWGADRKILIISMALGLLVCYAFGTAWFIIVYTKNTGPVGLATALSWCVIPYIVPDALKIALAALLTRRLKSFI